MDLKKKYTELCEDHFRIPVINQPWWLDTVCGECNWDVALVENGGTVVASMPYYMPQDEFIAMPLLTQTMGPWVREGSGSYSKELSRKQQLMEELIKQLPPVSRYVQQFHYSITDWLPFYWRGYKQTTRYTYVLDDLSDLDALLAGVEGSVRKNIRKARNRFGIQIATDLPDESFFKEYDKTFVRQGITPPDKKVLAEIIHASKKRGCGKTFFAFDENGLVHAVAILVWSRYSAYYLYGSASPELRNSGAQTLLLWEMIQFASTVSERFDFEGSMIQGVENSFRKFGGKQMPYFRVFYDRRTRRQKIYDRLANSAKYRINKVLGLLCK